MTTTQTDTNLILDLDSDFSDYKDDSLNFRYRWRLKQLDKLGEQIGRDYFPYRGTVSFKITEIEVSHTFGLYLTKDKEFDPIPLELKNIEPSHFAQSTERSIGIRARLDRFSRFHKVTCFGSDEPIENFELEIRESEEEKCVVSIFENSLYVNWHLPMPILMELMQEVRRHSVSQMQLFLSKCDGFYVDNEWERQTNTPKLLDHRSQTYEKLEIPEEYEVPVVGFVGQVSLRFEDCDDELTDSPSNPSSEAVELAAIRAQLKSLTQYFERIHRAQEWKVHLVGLAVVILFFSMFQ